jgi:hypothetical protein
MLTISGMHRQAKVHRRDPATGQSASHAENLCLDSHFPYSYIKKHDHKKGE